MNSYGSGGGDWNNRHASGGLGQGYFYCGAGYHATVSGDGGLGVSWEYECLVTGRGAGLRWSLQDGSWYLPEFSISDVRNWNWTDWEPLKIARADKAMKRILS